MTSQSKVDPDQNDIFGTAFDIGWSSAAYAIYSQEIPKRTASMVWANPGVRIEWEPLLKEKLAKCKIRIMEQFGLQSLKIKTWNKCFQHFKNGWELGCSDTRKTEVEGNQK